MSTKFINICLVTLLSSAIALGSAYGGAERDEDGTWMLLKPDCIYTQENGEYRAVCYEEVDGKNVLIKYHEAYNRLGLEIYDCDLAQVHGEACGTAGAMALYGNHPNGGAPTVYLDEWGETRGMSYEISSSGKYCGERNIRHNHIYLVRHVLREGGFVDFEFIKTIARICYSDPNYRQLIDQVYENTANDLRFGIYGGVGYRISVGSCHDWWDHIDENDVKHECPY